jgi:hypothetical protein
MSRFGRRRLFVLLVLSALASALSVSPALPVVAAALPDRECAPTMATAELQALLDANGRDPDTGAQIPVEATGATVVHGTTPQAFTAEILDIDYGGIGIDHDLIIAELSGLGIDGERGVWAGMSGSPLYIGAQLVGAVSYGFTWGASSLAGITPAAEMLAMSDGAPPTATARPSVRLDGAQRRSIAAQTNTAMSAVPARLPRLSVPLAINGSSERIEWLQRRAQRDGSRIIPVAGSGYSSDAAAAPGDIVAGSNFAAALSYGDIAAAGTGTTTWACGGEALAFGHPFFWEGRTTLGLHAAEAVTIAVDSAFGSYKLATLGAPVGTVDYDGFTGLHSRLDGPAFASPITSRTVAERPDGSLVSDTGTTNVAYSDYVPFISFIHGYANMDFLLDRYFSPGSSVLTWTVDMTHKGRSYRLRRSNQFNARWDVSVESMEEPWLQLERLAGNRFGKVRFDGIGLDTRVVDQQRHWKVARLQVRRNGLWHEASGTLVVERGAVLRVRAVLHRFRGDRRTKVARRVFAFDLGQRSAGARGQLVVGNAAHGGGGEFCFLFGECDGRLGRGAGSFGELVRQLRNAPRNDTLQAQLLLRNRTGHSVDRRRESELSRAITNSRRLRVRVTR